MNRDPTYRSTLAPSQADVRSTAITTAMPQRNACPPLAGSETASASPAAALDLVSNLVDHELQADHSSQAANPAPPPAPSDDEESLEAYLARLMERLTGGKPAADTRPLRPTEVKETAPAARPAVPPPAKAVEPVRPPENREQLAAMREVANCTARDALAKHAAQRLVKARRLLVAVVGTSMVSIGAATAALIANSTSCLAFAAASGAVALLLSARFLYLADLFTKRRALLNPTSR